MSPQGTNTPGVTELLRGGETPRVKTAGEGEPREDGRGRGGDNPLPITRETEARGAGGGNDKRMGRSRMAVPPRPQRGMAVVGESAGTLTRNTAGTDGTRTEHGALVRRKSGLPAPTETAVNLDDVGDQGAQTAMIPHGSRPDRKVGRRRRDTKPGGMRSQRAAYKFPGTREGYLPNGCTRLTCVASKRGKNGEEPMPRSVQPQRAARYRGGTPNKAAWAPAAGPRAGCGRGPPAPAARATRTREGGRGGHLKQATRIHLTQTEGGGRGGPPQTAA